MKTEAFCLEWDGSHLVFEQLNLVLENNEYDCEKQ